ncbi:hypothetical protein [Nesterenkonia suensis]
MIDEDREEERAVASFPAESEELLLLILFAQDWAWPGGEDLEQPAVLGLEFDGRRTQVLTLDDATATVGGQSLLISVPEEAPAAVVLEFDGHDQRVDARTGRRQLPQDDPAAGWYSLAPVHPHQSLIWDPEVIAGDQDVDGLEDRRATGGPPRSSWRSLPRRMRSCFDSRVRWRSSTSTATRPPARGSS